MSEPRMHHYQFAHHWIRGWFQHSPEAVIARLGQEDALDVLASLWEELGEQLPDGEKLSPNGLAFARRGVDHATCSDYFAIIEMPEPLGMTECHYIGMMIRSPDSRVVPEHRAEEGRVAKSWYFTLERSFKADFVTPTAILCSWSGTTHNNHGGDYIPDIDTFIDTIEQTVGPPLAS